MLILNTINYKNQITGKNYLLGTGRSFNIATIVGSKNVGKYTKDTFIAVPTGSGVNYSPMQTIGMKIIHQQKQQRHKY